MNVLAINGSARMEKGYTAMILTPFLEGMKEAGAQVELFYAKQLNINSCTSEEALKHRENDEYASLTLEE